MSIGDFGTGDSSLIYIRKLPVDEIKIDKSFVMVVTKDRNDCEMTSGMCQSLGFEIVVEGLENSDTYDLLKIVCCSIMQGCHLGRSMLNEQASLWLIIYRKSTITQKDERDN